MTLIFLLAIPTFKLWTSAFGHNFLLSAYLLEVKQSETLKAIHKQRN